MEISTFIDTIVTFYCTFYYIKRVGTLKNDQRSSKMKCFFLCFKSCQKMWLLMFFLKWPAVCPYLMLLHGLQPTVLFCDKISSLPRTV